MGEALRRVESLENEWKQKASPVGQDIQDVLSQFSENGRMATLKDTKPHVLLHEETEKTISNWGKEMADAAAVKATEAEYQENMARWTKEG